MPDKKEKTILIGLVLQENARFEIDEQLNELQLLAETAGAETVDRIIQQRTKIDPATYIGKGKIESAINQAKELECNLIIFNDEISPTQIKNVQNIAGEDLKVLDRTGLILDIFKKHAKTREAKTQVELAHLQYMLPRLTRQWTHLERQMGGIGTTGGPGETQIEIDRRLIRNQISKLKKDLEKIEKQRNTQSDNRKSAFNVSLVGYTNAGKSTLMNALTDADVYVEDQLFATLDTTTRKMKFESSKNNNILLSDTVGLIRKLPHDLVASFRSTLAEVSKADFILKVIDASCTTISEHLVTIDSVLSSLDSNDIPSQIILNKMDLIQDAGIIRGLKSRFPDAIMVSAKNRLKLDQIQRNISNEIQKKFQKQVINIPYSKSGILDNIYSTLEVLSRDDNEENISVTVFGREADLNSIIAKLKNLKNP